MTSSTGLTLGLDGIAALHAESLPQKDHLCGCFWAELVLRAAGVEDVDQDRVAEEAGTILPAEGSGPSVPPGEEPRRDYRLELATGHADVAGTAAPALADAVERLGEGRLAVVPVAGPWSEAAVVRLQEEAAAVEPGTTLVANIRSGHLWGARTHPSALLAHLAGQEAGASPPDWDVGHFVNLAALVRGRAGALVVVRDSYRSLGRDGYHAQPAFALARALERGDGREGGVLCVVPSATAPELRARLEEAGYDLRQWDNGTPARRE